MGAGGVCRRTLKGVSTPVLVSPVRPWAPRLWGAHLLGLACVTAAVLLGLWQLDAWRLQRAVEAMDLTQREPVAIAELLGPDEPFPGNAVGHPVEVAGVWLPDGTVFVSGRESDGVEGYWVVTPLAVGTADGPAVPVVRGWVDEPSQAPEPPTGSGEVVGWLQPAEGTGVVDEDRTDDVLPQLRVADVIQHVDQDIYSGYVVSQQPLDGLAPATLEQLPQAGTFTALRNLLYAIEWWIFGLFAAYVWWRYVRDVTHPAEDEEAADEDAPDDAVTSAT